ncbi:MAG TPA: nitrate transporter, partial [Pseudomonas sp.]|nr:nitrate transporter [Pseudomonas sp.]
MRCGRRSRRCHRPAARISTRNRVHCRRSIHADGRLWAALANPSDRSRHAPFSRWHMACFRVGITNLAHRAIGKRPSSMTDPLS